MFVCEPNYLVGEVLTCVCPNPRLVLTAGTSSVVCVWVYHKKQKQLQLQHSVTLYSCCKQLIGDVFTITEKAPTRAFSLLKAPTSTFTTKIL